MVKIPASDTALNDSRNHLAPRMRFHLTANAQKRSYSEHAGMALKWQDLDLENGVLKVRYNFTENNG